MPMKPKCAQFRPTGSTGAWLYKSKLRPARSRTAEDLPFPGAHWRLGQSWCLRNPVHGTPETRRVYELRRTDPMVAARVRALASEHTDRQIAALLDREGLRSGTEGAFSATEVQWIRYKHSIKSGCPDGPAACRDGYRGDGRSAVQEAARQLNVKISIIAAGADRVGDQPSIKHEVDDGPAGSVEVVRLVVLPLLLEFGIDDLLASMRSTI